MSTLESILSEVESKGITLEPNGDMIDIVGKKEVLTPELINELKAHKAEILRIVSKPTDPNLYGFSY